MEHPAESGPPLRRLTRALFVATLCVYLLTAPGRILFPDDEIAFQTTRSLVERGELAIEGIPKRTGELEGRPDGTFGWAEGRDGRRYGFFGHALSVVAIPSYVIGERLAELAPATWRHALRSDHYYFHARGQQADWTRLAVVLTNTAVTALGVVLFAVWVGALGFGTRVAVVVALAYGLGSSAWPYSRTFLSEPLSAAILLGAAIAITRWHGARRERPRTAVRWLALAGALAGASIHAHVLNVVALPCLLAWALAPSWRERTIAREKSAWLVALALATLGIVALFASQWARFGDPFETGRYDHYSWWIVPGEGLVAMLVAPGRSVLLFSPVVVVAALGWRELWRRDRALASFCAAMGLARLLFVACRSDWWGGWAVGPRFLVPAIPFLLVPLAIPIERWRALAPRRRLALASALVVCALVELHLSVHSIFEHMQRLSLGGSREHPYLARSHWDVDASPLVAFFGLPLDTLSVGAIKLARVGYEGPLAIFAVIAVVCAIAAVVLVRRLRAGPVVDPARTSIRARPDPA